MESGTPRVGHKTVDEKDQRMGFREISCLPTWRAHAYRGVSRERSPSDAEVKDACAKHCRLMISFERCVTMHENSSWVVQFTFAVHLASSTTRKGKSHICRHNFYHVVSFATEDYTEIRRRRQGKPLRACLAIVRETQYRHGWTNPDLSDASMGVLNLIYWHSRHALQPGCAGP